MLHEERIEIGYSATSSSRQQQLTRSAAYYTLLCSHLQWDTKIILDEAGETPPRAVSCLLQFTFELGRKGNIYDFKFKFEAVVGFNLTVLRWDTKLYLLVLFVACFGVTLPDFYHSHLPHNWPFTFHFSLFCVSFGKAHSYPCTRTILYVALYLVN